MPPSTTSPKIEELRFRVKTDPKSRLFYPLAEELRKVGACTEAEQVLRTGLAVHATYLSAWVSLGRTLRDLGKNEDAIEALSKALQLDPGNVVAARLLADAHLALGQKVEAIKKYKLVHALLPSDQELEALIERLDQEINPIVLIQPAEAEPEPEPEPEPVEESPMEQTLDQLPPVMEAPFVHQPTLETPFADEVEPVVEMFAQEEQAAMATGDDQPMSAAHSESPFEEPAPDFTEAAVEIEQPAGIHIEPAPLGAEVPTPWSASEEADVFAPAEEPPASATVEEPTETITMADLYAKQGLVDEARRIYESMLQRDPENEVVIERLEGLRSGAAAATQSPAAQRSTKVARLEGWLAKVGRREVSHV